MSYQIRIEKKYFRNHFFRKISPKNVKISGSIPPIWKEKDNIQYTI